jgi:choline monooxygenase
MFLHQSHLPQLLAPDEYCSQQQHRQEMERLFLPGWHCVASLSDLPREGSYLTMELFDHPLLIWRKDGAVHTYLNVCSHRFCMLTHARRGRQQDLTCQYHGWQYDVGGDTRRIPDAKSFRPMEKGTLGLKKFRTETIGQLIFVTLSDDAPPLEEYLGPGYKLCQELFSNKAQLVLATIRPNGSNWKVSLENSLESYHLGTVHRSTFGAWPEEQDMHHELWDRWSAVRVTRDEKKLFVHRLGEWVMQVAGIDCDLNYYQFHCYPNLVFARFGMFSWMEAAIPTSPTDSYDIWRFYSNVAVSGTIRSRLIAPALWLWGRWWFDKVIREDERIFPAIQRGLGAPRHPSGGLVSTREERVFHFQNYVKTATADGRQADAREQRSEVREEKSEPHPTTTLVSDL